MSIEEYFVLWSYTEEPSFWKLEATHWDVAKTRHHDDDHHHHHYKHKKLLLGTREEKGRQIQR